MEISATPRARLLGHSSSCRFWRSATAHGTRNESDGVMHLALICAVTRAMHDAARIALRGRRQATRAARVPACNPRPASPQAAGTAAASTEPMSTRGPAPEATGEPDPAAPRQRQRHRGSADPGNLVSALGPARCPQRSAGGEHALDMSLLDMLAWTRCKLKMRCRRT